MANEYKTCITHAGAAKLAAAMAAGIPLRITKAAAGDGNGADYSPELTQTALRREVWRGEIVSSEIDPSEPNLINIRFVIPPEEGGFTVREAGLYDDQDTLLAVCNLPATKKEVYSSGTTGKLTIIMHLLVTDAGVLEVAIRPDLDTVTWEQLDKAVSDAVAAHNVDNDAHRDILAMFQAMEEELNQNYDTKEQSGQRMDTKLTTHDLSVIAHGDIRANVVSLESRVKNLEAIVGGGISTNPFSVTFLTLDGVQTAGVWNAAQRRMEF